jgi:hypothetical protein
MPSQIGASLYFEEAINTSLAPMELGLGSTCITLVTQPIEFKNLRDSKILQYILPSIIEVKKLNQQAYT